MAYHRSITPAFVKEATRAVEVIEQLEIVVRAPQIQGSNLKVGPEMAHIVGFTIVIGDETPERVFLGRQMLEDFWVAALEIENSLP